MPLKIYQTRYDDVIDYFDKNDGGKHTEVERIFWILNICQMWWHTLAIILDIILFVAAVFQSNKQAINLMFGSAYTRIVEA